MLIVDVPENSKLFYVLRMYFLGVPVPAPFVVISKPAVRMSRLSTYKRDARRRNCGLFVHTEAQHVPVPSPHFVAPAKRRDKLGIIRVCFVV
jgi:hypothetical protein